MKTNFTYALRNIRNNTTNAIITVVGLSIAIACCLIIYFFISQQIGFNSFHKNADHIFRINYDIRYIDSDDQDVRLQPDIAQRLPKEIPQVVKSTQYNLAFDQTMSYRQNYFDLQASFAGPSFFEIFSFPFLAGSPDSTLANPYEIVITRKTAEKITGGTNDFSSLVGQFCEFPLVYGTKPFKIKGVIEDIPKNSSINFDVLVSGITVNDFGGCDNFFGYTSIYYQVKPNADATEAAANVNRFVTSYYKDGVKSMKEGNMLKNTDDAFVPFILPLKEVYLHGEIDNCFERSIRKSIFWIIGTIGFVILFIACSNYTILTLGQYIKKISDVGIRKAMGANSSNIFGVFMTDGLLLTFISLILGLLLCWIFIPVFNHLTQTEIILSLINIPKAILFVGLLLLVISSISSLVPVIVFAKVNPQQMAGKKFRIGNKSQLSQIFVSVQYSLSIFLIIVTLFTVRQSNFMKNKSLGFNASNTIDIGLSTMDESKYSTFKAMLSECPAILDYTHVDRNFYNGSSNDYVDKGNGEQIGVFKFRVDEHYLSTLELKLLEGRNFAAAEIRPNNRNVIVNKKFIDAFGIADDPIGKTYSISGSSLTIIGVVNDYHFFDVSRPISPVVLHTRTNIGGGSNQIILRYKPEQRTEVVDFIKKSYAELAPGRTFNYHFWDEALNQRYEMEDRWSSIIGYASAIAIIISSLGLFGLTVLLINQRIKEIGIRKVNGARSIEVLFTINKSFAGWLMGSLLVAIPLAYYVIKVWLSNFAYKTNMSWWVFIMAGTLALIIAFITVSWQSWRAATRNPVESLRYE